MEEISRKSNNSLQISNGQSRGCPGEEEISMPEPGGEQKYPPLELKVWGEWACFTRPEMKVERVSYPVMTPSAARGVLEAIFWEPQMYYLIDTIRVVKRGRWFSFRRNE